MDLGVEGDRGRVGGLGMAQTVDEVESGRRDRHSLPFVGVAAREGVSDDVCGVGAVLHREVEAQELADPMVLRDRGEALVEEIFQTVVVCLDDEAPPPEIQPPVPHGLDEADELVLVGGQRAVAGRHWPTEEGDRVVLLSQDRPKPDGRRVALDGEQLGEVRR